MINHRHIIKTKSGLTFNFIPGGGIESITQNGTVINNQLGNSFEAAPANLYIRIKTGEDVSYYALLGSESNSKVKVTSDAIEAQGIVSGISYKVIFGTDDDFSWFWSVNIKNENTELVCCDLVYLIDLALGPESIVKGAPYYLCQYIDSSIISKGGSNYLCSRQNLGVGNINPWLVSGCSKATRGFLTDGEQFFGLSFKESGRPEGLSIAEPEFGILQREFTLHAIYSEWMNMADGSSNNVTFFSKYQPNHPAPTSNNDIELIPNIPEKEGFDSSDTDEFNSHKSIFSRTIFFDSEILSDSELKEYFQGEWTNVEKVNGNLLSFYTDSDVHVVSKEKDLMMPKIHGHIMRGGISLYPTENSISATAWMTGVFGSHIAIGNPTENRFLSLASRNQWNYCRASGIRLFVQLNRKWILLGMPSLFTMGIANCSWIYKGKDKIIKVDLAISEDNKLTISANIEGDALPLLLFIKSAGGDRVKCNIIDSVNGTAKFTPVANSKFGSLYPNAYLEMKFSGDMEQLGGGELFFEDKVSIDESVIGIKIKASKHFKIEFTGQNLKEAEEKIGLPIKKAYSNLPKLSSSKNQAIVDCINSIIPWYMHNALIHFSKPYGIEQFSGGAWGTRDVSQGPIEVMNAVGSPVDARKIILKLYSKQYRSNGNWPQAISYDLYELNQGDSHGDIVVWPLKAVCDYLETTGDFALLDEQLTYFAEDGYQRNITESISQHIDRQLEHIRLQFMPETALISYGHGDWNDSLQPASPELAKNMISSWTVELTYQTITRYIEVCNKIGDELKAGILTDLKTKIQEDFNKHLIKDGLVAGFGLRNQDSGDFELLFHPQDKRTGIKHRLLPSTRGIISEIFTPEQAVNHFERIQKHLVAPDGARLMDRPPKYHGGEMKLFQRAETATFFGREIGIQYVHAHLRYAEAMAKLGKAEELLWAFMVVNPVMLSNTLSNAEPRQSNSYFSSSDAIFKNRYDASENYSKINQNKIKFAGGWRIYSSGPGIYIGLIQSRLLGLRRNYDKYIFDPVLSKDLGELKCDTHIEGIPVTISFALEERCFAPLIIEINGTLIENTRREENPYRDGGLCVDLDELLSLLSTDGANTIKVS